MKITEGKLRQIIRQELKEMMGDGPMNPKGLSMTPEEEILSAITSKPGGNEFLKRVRDAARSQRGLDRTDPAAVRDWLESAVAAGAAVKESKESSLAAQDYLRDTQGRRKWDQKLGWQNAGIAVGLGALGATLAAWAAKAGTPIDGFMDAMSYIVPALCAGTAGLEARDAIAAGKDVDAIGGVLSRVGKPAVQVPPLPGKLRETFPGQAYDRWKTTRPDEDDGESVADWIVGQLGKAAAAEHMKKPFESEDELVDWLYSKTPGAYDLEHADFVDAAREIWQGALGEA